MAESIEDLNLPKSIVSGIIKEALPPGVSATKEVKSAIARAASVFILFITSSSSHNLKLQKRKVILPTDIMESLAAICFDDYIPELKTILKEYKKTKSKNKTKKDETKNDTVDNEVVNNYSNNNHEVDENIVENRIDAVNGYEGTENGVYDANDSSPSENENEVAIDTLESDDETFDIEIDNAGLTAESDLESIKSDFETVEETDYSNNVVPQASCDEEKSLSKNSTNDDETD